MSNGNLGCLAFDFVDVSITEFPVRAEGGCHRTEPPSEWISRFFLGGLIFLEHPPFPWAIRRAPGFVWIVFRSCFGTEIFCIHVIILTLNYQLSNCFLSPNTNRHSGSGQWFLFAGIGVSAEGTPDEVSFRFLWKLVSLFLYSYFTITHSRRLSNCFLKYFVTENNKGFTEPNPGTRPQYVLNSTFFGDYDHRLQKVIEYMEKYK